MSEFELHLANELLGYEEVDWVEDRATLRIRTDGKYTSTIEASEWGKLFATLSSAVINKLIGEYGGEKDEMRRLFHLLRDSFDNEIDVEISELLD